MSEHRELTYDFFNKGQELPVYTHTVTEEEIDKYCRSTGEDNPVYLDDAAAREAGLEGRVAPPMMVRYYAHMQNVLGEYGLAVPGHSIHAAGEYQFLSAVRPGDTIKTSGRVIEKYIKKGRKYLSFELVSRNQRGEIAVLNRHTSVWPR
jgi:acyl dehydratase